MAPRRLGATLFACLVVLAWPCRSALAQITGTVVVKGLAAPVAFVQDPSSPAVQYVVEQAGRIRVVQSGTLLSTDFLNLTSAVTSGSEQGLLGLAFAPDYATSGRFYVNFTNLNGDTVVARFKRSAANPLVADPASRFDLLWSTGERVIRQPYANHNGGNLEFGPDGYLYIGMGDGGSADDPGNRAQDPNSLLGKMLRIDVNVADSDQKGYRVPPDNPFLAGQPVAALPEIWDFGLRNPWRFSFDPPTLGGTGALVVGDVGQSSWEEIDYEPRQAGGRRNYGWRNREGAHDHITTLPPAFLPLTDPIFEYPHTVGVAVVGGVVYRGRALGAAFIGRYFYADLNGRVWSLGLQIDPASGGATVVDQIEHTTALGGSGTLGNISSFGVDASGELYVVNYTGGTIVRLDPAGAPAGNWRIVGAGDFNGDLLPDLVWESSDGYVAVWTMNGLSQVGNILLYPYPVAIDGWHVKGVGDLDGDGNPDLIWENTTTGHVAAWLMKGLTQVTNALIFPYPVATNGWHIVGAAHLNGDGMADLIWQNDNGSIAAWYMNGLTQLASALFSPSQVSAGWRIVGAGDFNKDGKPDLVWQSATGYIAVWYIDNLIQRHYTELLWPTPVAVDGWSVVAVGDFNRDLNADLIWQNLNGLLGGWLMNTSTLVASLPLTPNRVR